MIRFHRRQVSFAVLAISSSIGHVSADTELDGFSFSSFYVDYARDTANTKNYTVGIDWSLMPDLRLMLSGNTSTNTTVDYDASTRQYVIGVSNDIVATTTVGFNYAEAAYNTGVKTRSMMGLLAFNGSNWSLTLTPSLNPGEIATAIGEIRYASRGIGTKLSLFGEQHWSGSISYGRYEYSRDFLPDSAIFRALAARFRTNYPFINSPKSGFVYGLERSYLGLNLAYRSGADGLIFDYRRSQSFLTSAITRRYTLTYSYDFATALGTKLSVAKQTTDRAKDLYIYGLSFVYSW